VTVAPLLVATSPDDQPKAPPGFHVVPLWPFDRQLVPWHHEAAIDLADEMIAQAIVGQLKDLAALKEQGILTEEEFAAQKARILGG